MVMCGYGMVMCGWCCMCVLLHGHFARVCLVVIAASCLSLCVLTSAGGSSCTSWHRSCLLSCLRGPAQLATACMCTLLAYCGSRSNGVWQQDSHKHNLWCVLLSLDVIASRCCKWVAGFALGVAHPAATGFFGVDVF